MSYRFHKPGPPLDQFVDGFWSCADVSVRPRERILPTGTVELVVNLRDDEIRGYHPSDPGRCRRLSGVVVGGPYGTYVEMAPSAHASVVGVHFRPGGAFPFLGIPANELADTHVDLDVLWGRAAVELREQLCSSATPQERFARLERALADRLAHARERHGAVPVALDAIALGHPGVRVRDVARQVGLSQRRFIQVFTAEVGLTPKLYARVRRFQRAWASVGRAPVPEWSRVAAACGYFDQSHLIRDFRAFAGLTPEAYVRRRSEYAVHDHTPQAG
jgi:AraC-like DNA-binding protein